MLLLWGFVLFASPTQFTPFPPEAITVDIVPAAAMAQEFMGQPRPEDAAAPQPGLDRSENPAGISQIRTASASPQPPRQRQRSGGREPVRAQPAPSEPAPNLLVFNATVPPVPALPPAWLP